MKEDESLRQQAEEAVSSAWYDMFGRYNGECVKLEEGRVVACTMEVESTDWNDEGLDPIYRFPACSNSFAMDSEPLYCPCCRRRVIWN